MISKETLDIRVVSSLAKIFPDEEISDPVLTGASMLMNERYSFQIAYRWNGLMKKNISVHVESPLQQMISIFRIGLVPSEMPCYADHDDNVLRTVPGLYPDTLLCIGDEGLAFLPGQWRSIWIEVSPDDCANAGNYPLNIQFKDTDGSLLGKALFKLEVIEARLPRQTLINTNWFHCDCIASLYNEEIFSEEHWQRMEQFIRVAVGHGINMILTPVFTPPLDTQIGGERPTVQLVDVELSGDSYSFGFEKLKRWFDICLSCGITYFEISHLFTQWGAKHAPKIIVNKDGTSERLFGWHTDATGKDYRNFLSQFLPELTRFIRSQRLESVCFFHISDEPSQDHIESYTDAISMVKGYLTGFPIIDALSDFDFYERKIVMNPIPATNYIKTFLDNNVPGLWAYYCCGQYHKVSNRFFNMPSARNRVIGMQLYKFDIKGFLHWGYNFWYSQYSRCKIDPFRVTDADYAFPSGDAFVVYPGEDGPIISLRLKVFFEGLQDIRALQLLEKYSGKEEVIRLLEEDLNLPLTFEDYPSEAVWLINKREKINRAIKSHLN
ncbi:MAG: DUF4091 domain-containing protein [Saccharofermentanales bacterium]